MPPLRLDRTLWVAVGGLIGAFLLFEFTEIDVAIQDRLFDFKTGHWLIDAQDPLWRMLLYTGPKALLILFGLGLLVLALLPQKRLPRSWNQPIRRHLLIALCTLASVPLFVGQLKAITHVFCPSETRRYGGDVPYVRVLECYPENDRPTRPGRCFPAGHASGGFALFALAGLATTRRRQQTLMTIGLCLGGAMGAYQMAKGAHYLSHTVVTAGLAWIFFLLWRRVFRVTPSSSAAGVLAMPLPERSTKNGIQV